MNAEYYETILCELTLNNGMILESVFLVDDLIASVKNGSIKQITLESTIIYNSDKDLSYPINVFCVENCIHSSTCRYRHTKYMTNACDEFQNITMYIDKEDC